MYRWAGCTFASASSYGNARCCALLPPASVIVIVHGVQVHLPLDADDAPATALVPSLDELTLAADSALYEPSALSSSVRALDARLPLRLSVSPPSYEPAMEAAFSIGPTGVKMP